MLRHLLLSVLALSLCHGQEPETSWSGMSIENPLQAAEADDSEDSTQGPLNATISGRTNWNGLRYGAHVEQMVLSRCEHYRVHYEPNFYGGPVINTRAWKTSGNERWTSAALINRDGSPISSTRGAVPTSNNELRHTWEMLYHSDSYQDIRAKTPPMLRFNFWNFFPQIYLPLYLENTSSGKAYMLHLYPEPSFLERNADYSFDDGVLWAKEGTKDRLFHVEIDIAGLIRNIDNFQVPNYQDFVHSHGSFFYSQGWNHVNTAYDFKRQIHVEGNLKGSATEYICRTGTPTMDISWARMKSILQTQMKWL